MKIKNIQVNAFGNIKNKKIELSENINIIQGNNESGKSTLLKFIVDMFYGISKNKRGNEFSDYDRYKPWDTEEFSGKISYKLDNGEKFEVYRDFNKKNPQIYNENAEDISKNYTIDKNNGNLFFSEQTKIDGDTYLSTFVSCQTEVKLEKQEQNILIQKLANLTGTGDDNVSYKKAIEKINKIQVEEIGTARTSGRPINIVKDELFKLQDEIGELEEFKEKQYELEERENNLKEKIKENEEKLEVFRQLKSIYEEQELSEEKILVHNKIIDADKEKIIILQKEKDDLVNKLNNIKNEDNVKDNNKKRKLNWILLLIAIITFIIGIIFRKNTNTSCIMIAIASIFTIMYTYVLIKNRKIKNKEKNIKDRQIEENKSKIRINIEKIDTQIQLLKNSCEEKILEIQKENKILKEEIDIKIQKIINKHNINETYTKDYIIQESKKIEYELNKNKLEEHSLQLDKENIISKLEKLSLMEERLVGLNKREEELLKKNEAIDLAKQVLETAYTKMRENVTPKFTQRLSKNIDKISNGKYKNIKINDEEGLVIEKENGEYISIERLSIGTIDQLYLSLRFGAIKEIADENMPIILDEAFAYYDEERLTNILKYINNEYKENQIIIFTCTNREKEILNKEGIKYNIINM